MAAGDKPKSILDSVPVVNQAFPKDLDYTGPADNSAQQQYMNKLREAQDELEVVSSCPQCGSPVYSKKTMPRGGQEPPVRHTCSCRLGGPLAMQTK